jgi:hypothetical protein
MNELLINLPSKNRQKIKNPSILINGQKVIDSDIEEKKESRMTNNFLTVEDARKHQPPSPPGHTENDDIFYTCP